MIKINSSNGRGFAECGEIESRLNFSNTLLSLFTKNTSRKEYLGAVQNLIREWSGCRCAGIRVLDDEGNSQYEAATGFAGDFCESGCWLSDNKHKCICSRAITGEEADRPEDSLITPYGSFFCNSLTGYFDMLSEGKKAAFRGVCVRSGFSSAASVPVKYRGKVIGAIHIADEGEGKVPLGKIIFLEEMAPFIGEALHRFSVEEELRRNYINQNIINSILTLSQENISLESLLEFALDQITSVPWLSFESKGCIFLAAEGQDFLKMVVKNQLEEQVVCECAQVPFGKCLCGKAAALQEIQFTDILDSRHEVWFEGIEPHGHYCVPILSDSRVLGVINLYLKEGHRRYQKEEEFLAAISNTLAGVIWRKQMEESLRESEAGLANAQKIARLGSWEWNVVTDKLRWSDEVCRIFSCVPEEFGATYKDFLRVVHPEDVEVVTKAVERSLRENIPCSIDHRIVLTDGAIRVVHEQAEVFFSEGRAVRMSGTVQDITDRKKIEDQIVFQASLLDQVRNAVIAADREGVIVYWNKYAEALYRWKAEEVVGRAVFEITVPEHERAAVREKVERLTLSKYWEGEMGGRKKDGRYFPAHVILTGIKDADGNTQGFVGVSKDISERKRAEGYLRAARQQLLDIIDFLPDPTFVIDNDRKVIAWNRAIEKMTGISKDKILGKGDYIYAIPFYGAARPMLIDLIFSDNKEIESGYKFFERRGHTLIGESLFAGELNKKGKYFKFTASPLFDSNGQIAGAIETIRDITDRKKMEIQLHHLATHDYLTKIPNRYFLEEKLKQAIERARCGKGSALLFLDVDNFKVVNDSLGHSAGDDLLIALANNLNKNLGEGECLFRSGGDEFAVLLEDTTREEAAIVAEKLRKAVYEEEICLVVHRTCFNLTVSIGCVMVDGSIEAQKILAFADTALYAAKDRGRNRVAFLSPEEDISIRLTEANQLVGLIRNALKEDRFTLHFQPVANLRDGKITHHEALLRLKKEDGELVYPGNFIPVAESFGLMPQIDRWVFEAALKVMLAYKNINLFINLSGLSVSDDSLLETIEKKILQSGLDHGRIGFEITETAAVKDLARVERWIGRIKKLGCNFALDDFGIGFSSFTYLRMLPVDYLKIDGSFVKNLDRDPSQRALIKAMNEVAHALGKKTIAECVENKNIIKILEDMGVDCGQGYYLGRPAPACR